MTKQMNHCFRKSTLPLPKKIQLLCTSVANVFPIFFQKQTIQLLHFAILYILAIMKMADIIYI